MISFCLIAKNEEDWIEDCLRSISPLASEIILADTGSTDRTVEITKSIPKVVSFEIPWENHFGNARNATIQKACEPWIFSFDADERISAKDIEKFRKIIAEVDKDKNFEAISLIRRDYVLNSSVSGFKPCRGEYLEEEKNYPGYYEERMIRVFRNASHIRWSGSLHETVDGSLRGKVYESTLVFHHYGYLPEEIARKKKRDFYEREGQRKISMNPADWKAHFDLAIEYIGVQEFSQSLPYFEKAIELKGPREIILSNFGYALMSLKKLDEAKKILKTCIAEFPQHHDALLNLGTVLMRESKWNEAVEIFLRLLKFHPASFMAWRNLGLCHAHLHDLPEAEKSFEKALNIFPSYFEAKLDLASVKMQQKDWNAAKDLAFAVLQSEPQHPRANQIIEFLRKV